jgi:hypothetical protein
VWIAALAASSAWVSVWSKYQALRDPLGVSGAPT